MELNFHVIQLGVSLEPTLDEAGMPLEHILRRFDEDVQIFLADNKVAGIGHLLRHDIPLVPSSGVVNLSDEVLTLTDERRVVVDVGNGVHGVHGEFSIAYTYGKYGIGCEYI